MLFKFGILLALVLLQVSIGVSYKFAANKDGKYDFQPAALLVSSEGFKCILAFFQHVAALRISSTSSSSTSTPLSFSAAIAQAWSDVKSGASWKFCGLVSILSLLYCVNNNLTFAIFALADPATFQLVKSMVPAVTAVLWANCLRKHVSETQWAAILLQVVGLCVMQYDACKNRALSPLLAYLLLGIAVMITSISGVFNEFMVKKLPVGLGVQNFFLYLFGAIFNGIVYAVFIPAEKKSSWLLEGVHGWGIVILLCNCFIGLVVTAVYKYADVNLKNFASSATSAVLLLISVAFLGMKPTLTLFLGIGVVFLSAHVYFVDTVRTQPKLAEVRKDEDEMRTEEGRGLLQAATAAAKKKSGGDDDDDGDVEKGRALKSIHSDEEDEEEDEGERLMRERAAASAEKKRRVRCVLSSAILVVVGLSIGAFVVTTVASWYAPLPASTFEFQPNFASFEASKILTPVPVIRLSQNITTSSFVTAELQVNVLGEGGKPLGGDDKNNNNNRALLLGDSMPWSIRSTLAAANAAPYCFMDGESRVKVLGDKVTFEQVSFSKGCCGKTVFVSARLAKDFSGIFQDLVDPSSSSPSSSSFRIVCQGTHIMAVRDCSVDALHRDEIGCPQFKTAEKEGGEEENAKEEEEGNSNDNNKSGEDEDLLVDIGGVKFSKNMLSQAVEPFGHLNIQAKQCDDLQFPPLVLSRASRAEMEHAFFVDLDTASLGRVMELTLHCEPLQHLEPSCGMPSIGTWKYRGQLIANPKVRIPLDDHGRALFDDLAPLIACEGLLSASLMDNRGHVIAREFADITVSPNNGNNNNNGGGSSTTPTSLRGGQMQKKTVEVRWKGTPQSNLDLQRSEVIQLDVVPPLPSNGREKNGSPNNNIIITPENPMETPTINLLDLQATAWCTRGADGSRHESHDGAFSTFVRVVPNVLEVTAATATTTTTTTTTTAGEGQETEQSVEITEKMFAVKLSFNESCNGLLEFVVTTSTSANPDAFSSESVFLPLTVAGPTLICDVIASDSNNVFGAPTYNVQVAVLTEEDEIAGRSPLGDKSNEAEHGQQLAPSSSSSLLPSVFKQRGRLEIFDGRKADPIHVVENIEIDNSSPTAIPISNITNAAEIVVMFRPVDKKEQRHQEQQQQQNSEQASFAPPTPAPATPSATERQRQHRRGGLVCSIAPHSRVDVLIHGEWISAEDIADLECAVNGIKEFARKQPTTSVATAILAFNQYLPPEVDFLARSIGAELVVAANEPMESRTAIGVLRTAKRLSQLIGGSSSSSFTTNPSFSAPPTIFMHGKGRRLSGVATVPTELACDMAAFGIHGNGQWVSPSYELETAIVERRLFHGPPHCGVNNTDFAVTREGLEKLTSEHVWEMRNEYVQATSNGNMPVFLSTLGKWMGCDVCQNTLPPLIQQCTRGQP